ncbi:PREDICTED: uncharacterized protein LOC108762281 [Trachymyrmex cornetzi]|uniref:uncharacterized protein LOC108762281 n=1 Tax=Trachymyrmex cornetzi TaxID=471704 RepID=UPI00084F2C9C|nr:PREDICTED: uncharacterized protein LOC108762281 [Trachymyrmex cornetzi]
MAWLNKKEEIKNNENMKVLEYVWLPGDDNKPNNSNKFVYENLPLSSLNNPNAVGIKISPRLFINDRMTPTVTSIRKKWFYNLSLLDIPTNIQYLLQLGENFALPISGGKPLVMEFIKSIENNIKKMQSSVHNNVRNHSADKGNITVALEKNFYIEKIKAMLSDEGTYSKSSKDPSNKINNSLRTLLARWKKSKFIPDLIYKKLYCSDGNLPRAYGSPKVHKEGCPFRVIISIDSTLYNLTAYAQNLITESVPRAQSYSLVSLDVVSLFTNVPLELAMKALSNRWGHIEKNCKIPKEEFLKAVQLILDSTYFTFDKQIYKQTFGTPMGSPLSPIIADMVMQDLESRVLSTIEFPVLFYYRYVDDIVLCLPTTEVEGILERFNSFHPRLQFTIEVGGNAINFLDTTIMFRNDGLIFDWYRKPTFSGRFLNYWSQHPISQKKGTILSLIDKVFFLSYP